jgi:hypothetical protein
MKLPDKIINNHSLVDKSDSATIQKIFRELMKLRDNVEEMKDTFNVKLEEQASRTEEQASRMKAIEDFLRKSPPLSAVGSSTDSTTSDSSYDTTEIAAQGRLTFENAMFKSRTSAHIDEYLQDALSITLPNYLLRYSTLAKTLRQLTYEEFIHLEDTLLNLRSKRQKKKKGVVGKSDNKLRKSFLDFLSIYNDAVFDYK